MFIAVYGPFLSNLARSGWFAVVGGGIKLLECSPQPAVRCVIVPSAPGYTLISCCCLFLCIRWLKTSVRQDGGVVGFIERVRDRRCALRSLIVCLWWALRALHGYIEHWPTRNERSELPAPARPVFLNWHHLNVFRRSTKKKSPFEIYPRYP